MKLHNLTRYHTADLEHLLTTAVDALREYCPSNWDNWPETGVVDHYRRSTGILDVCSVSFGTRAEQYRGEYTLVIRLGPPEALFKTSLERLAAVLDPVTPPALQEDVFRQFLKAAPVANRFPFLSSYFAAAGGCPVRILSSPPPGVTRLREELAAARGQRRAARLYEEAVLAEEGASKALYAAIETRQLRERKLRDSVARLAALQGATAGSEE